MTYSHFISYNIIGGIVWPALCLFAGYFFAEIPFVQDNFSLVAVAIILISVVPIFIEWLKGRKKGPKADVVVEAEKSE